MDQPRQDRHESGVPGTASSDWARYIAATREQPPRPLLLLALEFLAPAGDALDLGCGAGNDTRFLLACGFRVVAIDAAEAAIAGLSGIDSVALEVIHARFEEYDFQPSAFDIVNAQLSLPFTAPQALPDVMNGVVTTLRPGGIFAGQLFGLNDGWNAPGSPLSFVSRKEAERLFAGLELLHFEEIEGEVTLASGEPHHGHSFNIIARRPS